MTTRKWDPKGKYEVGFIKEYQHWVLGVSFRQHTLGCFIIFAKRSIERISDLENNEIIELKTVMRELETVLSKIEIFKPDRFNYLQLGNALHHLHFHAIPRYSSPRYFDGMKWIDETYGHPPIFSKEEVEKELVLKIKEIFLQHLES